MDLRVDNDVRTARPMTRAASLPALDQLPEHEPGLLDRIGRQLGDRTWLVGGAAGLGTIGAALLARRVGGGAVRSGVLGALGGAALVVAGGLGADAIRGSAGRRGAGPAASERIVADEDLRVMSFNVHMGKTPGELLGDEAALDAIAAEIRRERPDVVLLQEVDRFAVHHGFRDVLDELADRLDADGAVFTPSTRNVTGRESGTAVLTFNGARVADARGIVSPDYAGDGVARRMKGAVDTLARLVSGGRAPFDVGDYRPRTTADVLVTTPAGNAVRVLSGHWSWAANGVDHPRRQVDPLAGLLGAWDGPTIIGGDFNVHSGTRDGDLEAAAFAGAGLRDAFTAAGLRTTDPARRTFGVTPTNPLDRIYGSERLEVRDVRVSPFEQGDPVPSDHHPLVVDYRLEAE